MDVNNLIAKVGAVINMGLTPEVTSEKIEKRLQEARKGGKGICRLIHYL